MPMQKVLDEPLTKAPEIKWLDKKAMLNGQQRYEIVSVSMLEQDYVLELSDNPDNQTGEYMRLPKAMYNDLIDHFGNRASAWTGQQVTIKFDKFTPKPGSKNLSEGVQCSFVWPTEETFDDEPFDASP